MRACERTRGKPFTSGPYEQRKTCIEGARTEKRKETATEGRKGEITTEEIVFVGVKRENVLASQLCETGRERYHLCETEFFLSRVPWEFHSTEKHSFRALRESRVTLILVGLSRLSFTGLSYRATVLGIIEQQQRQRQRRQRQ